VRASNLVAQMRKDPKGTMEADLTIAAGGLMVILLGGVVAVAGWHPKWQPIQDNSPAPILGTIIVVAGIAIVLLGVLLALANVIVWLSGRRRRRSG
jgi:hypothetical protein